MGAVGSVLDRLRSAFRNDKDKGVQLIAKGATSPLSPGGGFDMLAQFGHDALSDYLRLEHDLLSRFVDYEEMDDYPDIHSCLDIYADDSSQPDTHIKRTLWATSEDDTLENVLDDLFRRRLRVDEECWGISRMLCKYGNDYEEILVGGDGVVGLNFLPAPTMRRIEGPRGGLHGFIQDFRGRFSYSPQDYQKLLTRRVDAIKSMAGDPSLRTDEAQRVTAFEDWEVVHFRLSGKQRRSLYGASVLEGARWIWKRLLLLEDAAMIYRLQRAPERFAFYVDVGDLPPNEALAYVNKVRQQHKKKKFVNPSNNKMDMQFNGVAPDEDFYVPVRKGVEGTRIDVLGGPAWQHMEDVAYFQNKLFSSLKVPKAYLNQDDAAARASLSSLDVRFARSSLRVQREIRNGFRKIARVHLASLGLNKDADFEINMTVPSAIFELAQLEVRNARADLAARMREHVSLHWILSNVYGLNDEDIKLIIAERAEDTLRDGRVQADVERMSALAQKIGEGTEPAAGLKHLEQRVRARAPFGAGISERELFAGGNRESEKRASEKLEKIMRSNDVQTRKLVELGGLIRDLKSSVSVRRR